MLNSLILALGCCAVASAVPYYGYSYGAHGYADGYAPRAAAAAYGYGTYGAPFVGCLYEPSQPQNNHRCRWESIRDGYGCVIDYDCVPYAEAPPPPCPSAPARPETGKQCNWIPIQSKRGCIIDYECEPVTEPKCSPAPVKPENGGRCKWTAIKDHDDCLIDWECEPRQIPQFFNPFNRFGGYPFYKK